MGTEISKAIEIRGEKYELGRVLGKGSFGKVFVLLRREKGETKMYAMKQMDKHMILQKRVVRNIINEKTILADLGTQSPFIIHLVKTFQTDDSLCMIEDFMAGGDLRFHMSTKRGQFTEEKVRFYASQMVLALEYLHKRGYIHRDIKPDNLLLDGEGYCYLADFNVSIKAETCKRKAGTSKYMAPELIAEKEYDKGVDWWAFGVTLYEIFYSESPFDTENDILQKPIDLSARSGSSDFKDLINGILQKNTANRYGVEQVKAHRFFKEIDWSSILERRVKAPYIPDPDKAHCSPDHEFEEVFGGGKRKKEKLSEADQALFKSWDWEEVIEGVETPRTIQRAIRSGSIEEISHLFKNAHQIDQPIDSRKNTYLHLAVRENRPDIVRLLIESKATVNVSNTLLWTPLHEACALGHFDAIQELLSGGANVLLQTKEGSLPLHFCVMHNVSDKRLHILQTLSKDGSLVNNMTFLKETPLHFACSSLLDSLSAVKYLVEQKVDVNIFNKLGFTPLHRAVIRRKRDVVHYLLDNGALSCNPKSGKSIKDLAEGDTELSSLIGGRKSKGSRRDKDSSGEKRRSREEEEKRYREDDHCKDGERTFSF